MNLQNPDDAPDMIAALASLGDLRVWSVIITIFGDAVRPRGGTVAANTLAAITERLSIKPEALRVALFRLAKDGWITRSKSGRNSYYGLSQQGLDEFEPATRRIYATAAELRGPWRLVGLQPQPEAGRSTLEKMMLKAGYVRLSPFHFLGAEQTGRLPDAAIVIEGKIVDLPDWARMAIAPADLQSDYAYLAGTLKTFRNHSKTEDPLMSVALRTLMIHQWRRLLLRHADLPIIFMPKGWQGEACRSLVLSLHDALSDHADPWLDAQIGPRQG